MDGAALQAFIVSGVHICRPEEQLSLPASFHQGVADRVRSLTEQPSSKLLTMVPQLAELFRDPAVDGALATIFGRSYFLDCHSHMHVSGPNLEGQSFHKDGPMLGCTRSHRPRLGLVMYYPHDVTAELGPTAVQPGSQYVLDKDEAEWPELALTVAAGTVAITHYDTFHRATANLSADETRYMLKFIVYRLEEPPLSARPPPRWEVPACIHDGIPMRSVWLSIWEWYHGASGQGVQQRQEQGRALAVDDASHRASGELSSLGLAAARSKADQLGLMCDMDAAERVWLAATLADPAADGVLRLLAAYALGRAGRPDELLACLAQEAGAVATNAADGHRYYRSTVPLAGSSGVKEAWSNSSSSSSSSNNSSSGNPRPYDTPGEGAPAGASGHTWRNPTQLDAAYGLAAGGAATVPALAAVLTRSTEEWWVTAGVVAALGEVGAAAGPACPALCDQLAHDNEWVARAAAEALGTIAVAAAPSAAAAAAVLVSELAVGGRRCTPSSLSQHPLRELAASSLARLTASCPAAFVAPSMRQFVMREVDLCAAGGDDEGASTESLRRWAAAIQLPAAAQGDTCQARL